MFAGHLAVGLVRKKVDRRINLTMIKPKSNLAGYGLGFLLLGATIMTITGMVAAPVPPPAFGMAISWITQPNLICGLAYWFDKL